MSDELKTCPFCKSKGAIRSRQSAGTMDVNWAVGCSNIKCVAASGLIAFRYDTREEAITAWNKRAERTCKDEFGHCSICGSLLLDGLFCHHCGAKVVKKFGCEQ